jgi:hypothetical protein
MQIHCEEEGKEEEGKEEEGKEEEAESFAEKISGGKTLNGGLEGICDDAEIAGR